MAHPQKLLGACRLMGGIDGDFDGHAHVFRADLPMAEGRRYTPDDHAALSRYASLLKASSLDGAILVQPSFLGNDNSFLENALVEAAAYDGMTFRGVAVLDPASPPDLDRLCEIGMIGIRLNVIGEPDERLKSLDRWDGLLRRIDRLGWHVELHCEGERLPPLLTWVLGRSASVVVDHFGLPDAGSPSDCPGQRAILDAPRGRVMVKASAPYRVFPSLTTAEAAERCSAILQRFHDHLGSGQLLWGSDWPWTRFERAHSFDELLIWRKRWLDRLG